MNDKKPKLQKDFISIKEASILSGIQAQTLRKLGDEGIIQMYRTHTGQRKFHRESLEKMCYQGAGGVGTPAGVGGSGAMTGSAKPVFVSPSNSGGTAIGAKIKNEFLEVAATTSNTTNFIYCRVSTRSQTTELEKQKQDILSSAATGKIPISVADLESYKFVKDICHGTNFDRKGLNQILKTCVAGKMGTLVVYKPSILASVGIEMVENIIRFAGGNIVYVERDEGTESTSVNEFVGELVYMLQNQQTKMPHVAATAGAGSVTDSVEIAAATAHENEEIM